MLTTSAAQYAVMTNAADGVLKSARGEVYGFVVQSSTAGTITISDESDTVDVLVFSGLTAGQVVHFGGTGITFKKDITVTIGGTATISILYV